MTQQQKTGEYMDARNKEELHAQIDQTKSAIAGELRELGEKLSPEHLKEGMKDMLQEAKTEAKGAIMDAKNAVVGSLRNAKDHAIDSVSETVSEVSDRARRAGTVTADFVSANAIPLSLIGIGAGWLMLTMRRQRMLRESSYYGRDYGRSYERDYEYGQRRFGEWNERDFDDYGACFVSNCVNPHLFHMIQGGHYEPWRNRPSSLYAYERLPTIADHLHYPGGDLRATLYTPDTLAMGGGHAHCGTLVYLGGSFPADYRNTVLMCNVHGHRVNRDILFYEL